MYRQLRLSFPYGGEPAYCPNRLGNQLSGQRNPESGTAPSGNRLPEVRNSSRSGISCSRCRGGCSSSGQIRHERLLPTGRPLLSSVQAVWKYCRSSSGCRRRFDFLPFLVDLAGFVSCDEIQPDVAVGCVTVDNEQFCALTSAIGNESEGNQKWALYDEGKVRVNVSGYKCRCGDAGHIPFTLTFIDIDLPGIATMDAI